MQPRRGTDAAADRGLVAQTLVDLDRALDRREPAVHATDDVRRVRELFEQGCLLRLGQLVDEVRRALVVRERLPIGPSAPARRAATSA